MQLERYLIEHCAPTLASLKAGSLICLKETVEGELDRQIHTWNARLREKGLVLMALRRRPEGVLVYLYPVSYTHLDVYKRQI